MVPVHFVACWGCLFTSLIFRKFSTTFAWVLILKFYLHFTENCKKKMYCFGHKSPLDVKMVTLTHLSIFSFKPHFEPLNSGPSGVLGIFDFSRYIQGISFPGTKFVVCSMPGSGSLIYIFLIFIPSYLNHYTYIYQSIFSTFII